MTDLDNAWDLNPLIDGKTIMAELEIKPGAKVKEWVNLILPKILYEIDLEIPQSVQTRYLLVTIEGYGI